MFFFEGFDNPSGSKCDWSVEASKSAGHHEQDSGWGEPWRADHGRLEVSQTIQKCLNICCLSCFDKNGSGTLTRSDMENVLSVSCFISKISLVAPLTRNYEILTETSHNALFRAFSPQNLGERLYEDEIKGLLDDGDEGDGTIVYNKFFAMESA